MDRSPTPNLDDVFAYVDEHAQAFLARLIDYVRRPSISAYGEGIGEVAEYIASVMRGMGLWVEMYQQFCCMDIMMFNRPIR
jgi:acetylornithine deacetylase/succinyl-diaminopimelate desuccinylase-like protein